MLASGSEPAAPASAHAPGPAAAARRSAEAGALLVMVFWAANFIIVKAANHEIPPISFALVRFALASIVLLTILRVREGSIGMPRADLLRTLGLGAVGFGIYQILWPTALQTIPAGDSALLIAATPVITAVIAGATGIERLSRSKVAGALISFAGVAIVIAEGPGLSLATSLTGDLLTLLAAFVWGIYMAFGSRLMRVHSPLRSTAWAMVGGTLVLTIPGALQANGVAWGGVSISAWGGLLYSSIIAAGISNVLVFRAIKLLGPTPVTALQSLVPFLAVLMGAAFLAESIRPEQIVGGVVIVVGVMITRAGSSMALRLRELLPLE